MPSQFSTRQQAARLAAFPSCRPDRFARIDRIARASGYVRSGNHLFTRSDFQAIQSGLWRASVMDRPSMHPRRIAVIAELLSSLY